MIIPSSVVNSINANLVDISSGWLYSSVPVYNSDYTYEVIQPLSVEALVLSDLRFREPEISITIRSSASETSKVLWSGVFMTDEDPVVVEVETDPTVPSYVKAIEQADITRWNETNSLLSGKSDVGHNHNDLYFTEAETNSLLSGKSDVGHIHDDRYFTEAEVTSLLANKQNGLAKTVFEASYGNGGSTAGWCKLGTYIGNSTSRFIFVITGKAGWNDQNFASQAIIHGGTNYITVDNGQIAAGCKWNELYGSSPTASHIRLVRQAGYGPHTFDLYILQDSNYVNWTVEVTHSSCSWTTGTAWQQADPGNAANVFEASRKTVWDSGNFDPATKSDVGHIHDDRYYTEAETISLLAGKSDVGHNHNDLYFTEAETNSLLSGKSDTGHTHDDRYYTEAEANSLLAGKSDVGHIHDDRYFTEAETNSLLSGKSDVGHIHDDRYFTEAEITTALSSKSDVGHIHDDRYFTEAEITTALSSKSDTGHTHVAVSLVDAPHSDAAPSAWPGSGMYGARAYNQGYPSIYGNVISVDGSGRNQIFLGWAGTNGGSAGVWIRNKRDIYDGWSPWQRLLDTVSDATSITSWNNAAASSHAHGNKTNLDAIDQNLNSASNPYWTAVRVGTSGVAFPVDAFGGGGDSAGIRLINKGSEAQSLEIYVTNDADDWLNIIVPDVNAAKVNGYTIWNHGNFDPATKSDVGHTHDDRYYTEAEANSLLAGKSNTGHTHDDRYFTEAEITTALSSKSDVGHSHNDLYFTEAETTSLLAGKSDTSHGHNVKDLAWSTEHYNDVLNHGKNGITDGNSGQNGLFGNWAYQLKMIHSYNPNDWQFLLAADFFTDDIAFRRKANGVWQTPYHLWHSGNMTTAQFGEFQQAALLKHNHSNKTTLDLVNQSLATTASPTFAGVTAGVMTLQPNGAQVYNGTDYPPNFIGQVMAENDGWKIYGEGTNNAGRIVFEVNDDADEGLVFKQRKTYSPYTTNVYTIWHEGNFTPGSYLPLAGGTMTGSVAFGDVGNNAGSPAINYNGAIPTDGYKWIIGDTSSGTGFSIFANGSTRTADGGPNTVTIRNERGALDLGYITKSIRLLASTIDCATDARLRLTRDVTPSSSPNTNYSNAPIVINRASTSGTTTVAGLGFHNINVNGALLYYDPTMSQFRYNNDIGDINTLPSVLTSYGGNLDMGTFNTTTGGTYDVYTIPANVFNNTNGGRLRLVIRGYTGNNWECKLKIGGQQLFRIDANLAESMVIECSIGGGVNGTVMGTVTTGYWNNVDSATSGLSRNYNLCAAGIDFSTNILIQLEIKGVDYPIGVYLNHLLVQKY